VASISAQQRELVLMSADCAILTNVDPHPATVEGNSMKRMLILLNFLTLMLVALPGEFAVAEEREGGREVRVAAISLAPVKFDLKGNARRLKRAFRKAKKGGAELAVAPEGVLEGYVVNEIIAGRQKAERMKDVAVPIDGPVIGRFKKLARELEMCLVFGFAERIGDDVFNCAVFIDDAGEICGKYHKMQLAEGYHPSWWFNRLGEHSRAFDTPLGRCGLLICNDRWNPALARIPALDGAQFLVIPSYGSRSKKQDEAVLSRGAETGLPVVEANVGVTLIVDDAQITAVDRREEAITFATITIPPATAPQPKERNRVERAFLQWREQEMQSRYEKAINHLRNKP
jgi:predicted amidohydrolase